MTASARPSRRRRPGRRLRRSLWFVVAVAVAGLLAAADRGGLFGRAADDDTQTYHEKTFRVVYAVDGDTLDVDCPDARNGRRSTRVRLLGVDTPETKRPDTPVQHFGPEASAFTARATIGKNVRLRLVPGGRTRGTHGRLLAYVEFANGTLLNRELITQGFGYADPRFKHPHLRDFTREMKQAQRKKRGLWAEARNSDLPAYLR